MKHVINYALFLIAITLSLPILLFIVLTALYKWDASVVQIGDDFQDMLREVYTGTKPD